MHGVTRKRPETVLGGTRCNAGGHGETGHFTNWPLRRSPVNHNVRRAYGAALVGRADDAAAAVGRSGIRYRGPGPPRRPGPATLPHRAPTTTITIYRFERYDAIRNGRSAYPRNTPTRVSPASVVRPAENTARVPFTRRRPAGRPRPPKDEERRTGDLKVTFFNVHCGVSVVSDFSETRRLFRNNRMKRRSRLANTSWRRLDVRPCGRRNIRVLRLIRRNDAVKLPLPTLPEVAKIIRKIRNHRVSLRKWTHFKHGLYGLLRVLFCARAQT